MSLRYDKTSDLFDRYDAFLIDQFGVLMSGDGPYPAAQPALARLAALGKPTIILSNSGKRAEPNCQRLVRNGFDRAHFKTVLTSGDVAHRHIAGKIGQSIPQGARVLVLIKDGDAAPLDGLDLVQTDQPDLADLFLIVSRDPQRSLDAYTPILTTLANRNAPGICMNPDLRMLTPTGPVAAAGHLGKMFESLGGRLDWFGKPHRLIYDHAKAMLGDIDPARVLCIGDSLPHDIVGGGSAGFKTALVRTGVDADLDDEALENLIAGSAHKPNHMLKAFAI